MSATLLEFPGAARARCRQGATAETFDDLTYARAASYLALGQLYLDDNPLLADPLAPEHLKRHPAGPWRHVATFNLLYAQLNRLVRLRDIPAALLPAPAAAAPALLANLWLEGTYSERVPAVTRDVSGMRDLFRSYRGPLSVPAALGARVLVGGVADDLGPPRRCVLAARGATLGAPASIALCVVEDLDAPEVLGGTGPRGAPPAGRDGLVLPVLLVPASGDRLARADELVRARGMQTLLVEETEELLAHAAVGETFVRALEAHAAGERPALVFVEPAVRELPVGPDGESVHPASGAPDGGGEWLFLAHAATDARERASLVDWMLSYAPDVLFDAAGAPAPRVAACAPPAGRRVGERVGVRPD